MLADAPGPLRDGSPAPWQEPAASGPPHAGAGELLDPLTLEALAELSRVRAELDELESSAAWWVVSALRRRKEWVIPLGSRRERVWAGATRRARALVERLWGEVPRARARLAASRARPRLLAVSGPGGASRRYRCAHLIEALERLGGSGAAVPWDEPSLADAAAWAATCELLLLHRAPATPALERLVAAARARGAPVIYDADDLVFDPDEPLAPPLRALLPPSWIAAQRRALALADLALVATEPLAERVRALGGPPARVLRNGFSEAMRAAAARAAPRPPDGRVVLGYASGSPTHARDFAQVAPALAGLLEARADVVLAVIGALELPPALARLEGGRVRRAPAVPWALLPALLARFDVNLAPLEQESGFSCAKSELKWLEAALVGVPTVASATPAFRRAIEDGVDGLLVERPAQWGEALARLVDDPAARARIGAAARAKVEAGWSPARRAGELRALLRELGLAPAARA